MRKRFKTVLVFLSAIMLFTCAANLFKPTTVNAGLIGDVNEDGIVNSKDLSMVQKIIIGKYETKETEAPEKTAEPSSEPVVTPAVNGAPPIQRSFKTVEEFMNWAAAKEERYEYIEAFYEDIEEDGGVYVPYYDGTPMEFRRIRESTIGLMERVADSSYSYDYAGMGMENIDGKGTEIMVSVLLGDRRDNVKEHFTIGKKMDEAALKEAGALEIMANIGGEETEVIFKPHCEEDANERAWLLYENRVIVILFYSSNTDNNLEILEKISFKKVLFDEIEK